jgi:cytochrome c
MSLAKLGIIGCAVMAMASVVLASADSMDQVSHEGDVVRGKAIFERRCAGCHTMDQNREGPRLRGVFGRTSGSVDGYDYSPGLKNAHIVWNETALEQWLSGPDTLIPGNNMDFFVPKAQERRDVIRYLQESAGK